jgi:putative oxidoreductase
MELITRRVVSGEDAANLGAQPRAQKFEAAVAVLEPAKPTWDEPIIAFLNCWSIPALRVALGLVFVWFGALKLFGVSPVIPMLRQTYGFLPLPLFGILLGLWELLIGSALIFRRALRRTLVLLCLHLIGTFVAVWLAPQLFFLNSNPLLLTANGEFVVKNLVLVTAGLVIGGHEMIPLPGGELKRKI